MAPVHRADTGEHQYVEDGFEQEKQALEAWPKLLEDLLAQLAVRGFRTFTAPIMPGSEDFALKLETRGCRVLVMWLPPWGSCSRHAGKFVARVDTIASRRVRPAVTVEDPEALKGAVVGC